jgi:hypothetical protein
LSRLLTTYYIYAVGQKPYQSRNSGRLEHRPIGSTIPSTKGSDLMLIKLAKSAFQAASWPTVISTGRYMYPLRDNIRNVALVSQEDSFGEEEEKAEEEGHEQTLLDML